MPISCADTVKIFGHKAWAIVKGVIGLVELIFAGLIFANLVCTIDNALPIITPLATVIAAVMVICGILVMTDGFGGQMLLAKFRKEIARLHGEVTRLSGENDRYADLNTANKETSDRLQGQVYTLDNTNKKLVVAASGFRQERQKFEKENLTFKSNLKSQATQLDALQVERNKFAESNKHLVIIQKNAQTLITSLMSAGDDFTKFGVILEDSVGRMEDTNTTLERLVNGIGADKFNEIDIDGDGLVTQEELIAYAEKKENQGK
jgi:hypothetical protein